MGRWFSVRAAMFYEPGDVRMVMRGRRRSG